MPVEKYRSLDEMRRALWRHPVGSDRELLARIDRLWRRASRLAPARSFRRGVVRFHSIEEAQTARKR